MYANRARLTPNELVLRLDELRTAIKSRTVDGNLYKAEALAMYIARSAPNGRIANLAMRAISAVGDLRKVREAQVDGQLEALLSELGSEIKAAVTT